ncbi:universal stress protein [Edaphobacter paludis]|uniref:Universal stress protein n=1 Tax=Edaphobacter paludis TaxID=3035702 RepID=A0AAU7D8B9_9BACT
MFKKIAVAYDESPEAERAFRSALGLAKLVGGELYLITVIENQPAYMSYVSAVAPEVPLLLKNQKRAFYEDLHNKARATAEKAGVSLHAEMIEGNEIDALLQGVGRLLPELLVVGLRRDSGGISRYLGGTAHQLALHAKCDVLGVR